MKAIRMHPIDPSHFATISFLIFVGFLIWKRFFNVHIILDDRIKAIEMSLKEAAHRRSEAYNNLKQMNDRLNDIDIQVATILEKATETCTMLSQNFNDQIAYELTRKQENNAKQMDCLRVQFDTVCKERLIQIIMQRTKTVINAHGDDTMHNVQLDRSLALLAPLTIAT